jgi:hypothetical protein
MTQHHTYLKSLELAAAATQDQLDLTSHRGEEGRHIEAIVMGILEKILPKRFSLGSGFVVNFRGDMSTQQDIVLFDNLSNAPLLYEGQAGVYTAEAVYATIEVKKNLSGKVLNQAARKIGAFRKLASPKFVHMVREVSTPTGWEPRVFQSYVPVSPRTYVIAMDAKEASWTGHAAFGAGVARASAKSKHCHLHGVCVMRKNWFAYERADTKEIVSRGENALAALYEKILSDAMTFIVRPAVLDGYLDAEKRKALEAVVKNMNRAKVKKKKEET